MLNAAAYVQLIICCVNFNLLNIISNLSTIRNNYSIPFVN